MPLLPDAAIDDGVLDVVILHPQPVPELDPARRAGAVQGQAHRRPDQPDDRPTVSSVRARDTPRQLDGDSIGAGRELHAECVHGRLLVRVPR